MRRRPLYDFPQLLSPIFYLLSSISYLLSQTKGVFAMKKRMLTALLTCCLALSLAVPALGAQAAVSEDEAVQAVTTLGIMTGDASGDLDLSARSPGRNSSPWPSRPARAGGRSARRPPPPTPTCPGATGPPAMWRRRWPGAGLRIQRRHLPPRPADRSGGGGLPGPVPAGLRPGGLLRGLPHRPAGPVPQSEAGPGRDRPERRRPPHPPGRHVPVL